MKNNSFFLVLLLLPAVASISACFERTGKTAPIYPNKLISFATWQEKPKIEWNLNPQTERGKITSEINPLNTEFQKLNLYREAVLRGEIVMGVTGLNRVAL
ncbi:hypothetical protein [Adhaeribacter soli]|uniref:Uncharacterized protein n=1 Tax=Adhaeribacter soli TaxID=2607655 RepID=A0A5N1IW33_9BACT|nr:hypothetical protein [Adhaeribacter soli]KAA9332639.1 hypothetical protein F0P94_11545 [Adhaeribacter soli]